MTAYPIVLVMCLITSNIVTLAGALSIYLLGKDAIKREFMRIFKKRGYMFVRISDLNRQFKDYIIFPDKDIKDNMISLADGKYVLNPEHVYFGKKNTPWVYMDKKKCTSLPLGQVKSGDIPSPKELSTALKIANMAGSMDETKKPNKFVNVIPFIMLILLGIIVWLSYQTNTSVSLLTP